jgi:hypothetical protein
MLHPGHEPDNPSADVRRKNNKIIVTQGSRSESYWIDEDLNFHKKDENRKKPTDAMDAY